MQLDTFLRRSVGYYQEGISIYLVGDPGGGKTDTVNQVPKRIGEALGLNMGMVTISGPLMNVPDTCGYLALKHMPDGSMESAYTLPHWYRTREGKLLSEYDGGIVFIDEADKAEVDVKKIMGEAALSGMLGSHQLPKGWVVWAAGNYKANRSGSTKELDHLIGRRMELSYTPSLEAWMKWANKNGVSALGKSWAQLYPEVLLAPFPEKQGPWCNPRSATRLFKYLERITPPGGDTPDDPDTLEEATGMVGTEAAQSIFTHLKLQVEIPDFDSIVAAPDKAKIPVKPDVIMLACFSLAHRVTKATADPVIQYIKRLPADFTMTFAKAAVSRDKSLVTTPAFMAWATKNAALMAVCN